MADSVVIFVDAGFLLAAGGQVVTGNSLRSAYTVDLTALVAGIQHTVTEHAQAPILRTYWYDAAKDALPLEEHKRLGMMTGVKVRLGRLSYNGEQKGVDMKLALDLVGLAQNGAAKTAYILSGDDDLAEAIEEVQDQGMRSVLLGIPSESARLGVASVAEHLALCVDEILPLPDELIASSFTKRKAVAPTPRDVATPRGVSPWNRPRPVADRPTGEPAPTPDDVDAGLLRAAADVALSLADNFYTTTTQSELARVLAERPQIPLEIDRVLLKDCAARIGETSTNRDSIKKCLRESFWAELDRFG